jgi:superfamily I DNA/RNA helicase
MPLNAEQRAALWNRDGQPIRGHRILSARPGTGKTTTLTSYCIDLVERWPQWHQPWQGIAMLSYTNVAKDELQHKIRKLGKAAALLQTPHFVGTVDAFVNQYLFLPHAAAAMGTAADRPMLVGEPYQQWKNPWNLDKTKPGDAYSTMWFDCYSAGLDGRPIRIDGTPRPRFGPAKNVTDANATKILAMKRHVWANGLALQADANYLAYQALLSSQSLTTAITRRFPAFIVDEAQDLTEIQHAILDHLVDAGLDHAVVVGDENQAIYEWNTARPELFIAKATSGPPWTSALLTETYRCSPAVCITLTNLAGDGTALVPADDGKNKAYTAPVIVRPITSDNEPAEVAAAIDELAAELTGEAAHDGNDDNTKSLLVLTRGADHARQLKAAYSGIAATATERTVWEEPLTRDFLKVIYFLSASDQYRAVEAYESLLRKLGEYESVNDMRVATRREWGLPEDADALYRVALFADLKALEEILLARPCMKISDGVALCDVTLRGVRSNRLAKFEKDCASFRGDAKRKQDQLLSSIFSVREARDWQKHNRYSDVRVGFATAHASKGETHDAVLLVTKSRAGSCGCPQPAAAWPKILTHSMSECEAKRIVYVAMSRAAQHLSILAPAGVDAAWHALTLESGVVQT